MGLWGVQREGEATREYGMKKTRGDTEGTKMKAIRTPQNRTPGGRFKSTHTPAGSCGRRQHLLGRGTPRQPECDQDIGLDPATTPPCASYDITTPSPEKMITRPTRKR
jgi:hypothetical protein